MNAREIHNITELKFSLSLTGNVEKGRPSENNHTKIITV